MAVIPARALALALAVVCAVNLAASAAQARRAHNAEYSRHLYQRREHPHPPLHEYARYFELVDFHPASEDTHHADRRRDVSEEAPLSVVLHSHGRKFHLLLHPHRQLFAPSFHAVEVRGGQELPFDNIHKDAYMRGHVRGERGASRVRMHVDSIGVLAGHIVSADGETYVVEPASAYFPDAEEPMVVYRLSDVNFHLSAGKRRPRSPHEPFCGVRDGDQERYRRDAAGSADAAGEEGEEEEEEYEDGAAAGLRRRGGSGSGDGNASANDDANSFSSMSDMFQHRSRRESQTLWQRRSSSSKQAYLKDNNACEMTLVADYEFYKQQGLNTANTIKAMVDIISQVDSYYLSSRFDHFPDHGFRLSVKKIIVYSEEYDPNKPQNNPYGPQIRDVKELLNRFGDPNWNDVCLAHLFTHRDFDGGTLGLAAIGSTQSNFIGGICAKRETLNGVQTNTNTGLSTTLNWGATVPKLTTIITVAHEVGHNFGSEHDKAGDANCDPSSGGKFVMYPSAQNGAQPNNVKFSPCSKTFMGNVVMAKGGCFEPYRGEVCGNGIVEEGEECDAGGLEDPCCTSTCEFEPRAVCSPTSEQTPCCDDTCSPLTLAEGKECAPADPANCLAAGMCQGKAECDQLVSAGRTRCKSWGSCARAMDADESTGQARVGCTSFCDIFNADTCVCQAAADQCKVCCKRRAGDTDSPVFPETCTPALGIDLGAHASELNKFYSPEDQDAFNDGSAEMFLDNAVACPGGFCNAGVCELSSADEQSPFAAAAEEVGSWIKTYLVCAVLIGATIALIPAFLIIRYSNMSKKKKENFKRNLRRSASRARGSVVSLVGRGSNSNLTNTGAKQGRGGGKQPQQRKQGHK